MSTKPVNFFSKTPGLNVVVDPVRLQYDSERGIQELAVAFNIDIDQTGRPARRRGMRHLNPVPCHSVKSIGEHMYCVAVNHICIVNEFHVYEPVIGLAFPSEKVWYLELNGDVYWSNGLENGILRGGEIPISWNFIPYSSQGDDREFVAVPPGKFLTAYAARIFFGVGKTLCCTEHLGYHWFDPVRNITPFASDLKMIQAVSDGLYVGTGDGVYFLQGASYKEFVQRKVADSPPIEGMFAMQDGRKTTHETTTNVAMWTALDGIYAGLAGGVVVNTTVGRLQYPEGSTGSAAVNDDAYLSFIDP